MNGCDYNTMSVKMACDCSGKGVGLVGSSAAGALREVQK